MPSALKYKEEKSEGNIKISLSGEVDIYTSQDLKEKLHSIIDTMQTDIKMDCKELNYIDSTGLGVLVGALKKAMINGRRIYIINLKDHIKKLFIITGLDKIFMLE